MSNGNSNWTDREKEYDAVYKVLKHLAEHPEDGTACVGNDLDVFVQAEDGIRDLTVTGVQTCALPISDCKALARQEEIFQQAYMCNPLGASTNRIVEWSAIERCRYDYPIERLHLEAADIIKHFGEFNPSNQYDRQLQIQKFLRTKFPRLFAAPLSSSAEERARVRSRSGSPIENQKSKIENPRLGFDVAASGQGDLAVFYLDEPKGNELWLRALLTARTDDWDFLERSEERRVGKE